jgi:hypothetical protein
VQHGGKGQPSDQFTGRAPHDELVQTLSDLARFAARQAGRRRALSLRDITG